MWRNRLTMSDSIIITGGRGFVGQHLKSELQRIFKNREIISWDLPEVNITKPETYQAELRAIKPAWIYHLAAFSSVGKSFALKEQAFKINVEGTKSLLEAMTHLTPHTGIIVASSADIYGQGSNIPLPELPLEQCQPKNPYAASKLAMERLIIDDFNSMVIRVRPFPHIGPGQQTGFVTADFASQIAAIEKQQQPPIMKVGNLKTQRDFTDVRDVVRAYCLLMEHGKRGEVYNIASGQAVSVQSILKHLLTLTDLAISVEPDQARLRSADIAISLGDATKLKQTTNWRPEIPLEQSLKDILNFWRTKV